MSIDHKLSELIDGALIKVREDFELLNQSPYESPIERLLRAAFHARQIAGSHWITVKFMDAPSIGIERLESFVDEAFQPWELMIWPQVMIGDYRVDFLAQGALKDRKGAPRMYLAIECDGHEFHEKTKEQAARDKARDRYLLGRQIPVMRFAGSEIWRSPLDCADQAIAYFEEKYMPDVRAAQ